MQGTQYTNSKYFKLPACGINRIRRRTTALVFSVHSTLTVNTSSCLPVVLIGSEEEQQRLSSGSYRCNCAVYTVH
ncbi:hypothetical protein AB205_0071250 [Aquarana catesbeiana]|uniref:Uncharacterized protein n=1 Tax=Aquarana catesbeiana TaxID=8400 RepID=A0A2G9Q2N1_AQUCT|nr:hypothetical protein AB205_0071250 [Aquarana catesbeiana]